MFEQLYRSRVARGLIWLLARPALSRLAGRFMDSRASKPLIKPFIRKNHVRMQDVRVEDWKSFNAFFTRALRPGARPIDPSAQALISPCDGFLSAYPVTREGAFTVKGTPYTVSTLLGDEPLAEGYLGGVCLSYRLTSADYHHYVFPDDGEILARGRVPGIYHTVRPFALGAYPVYKTNTREWAVLRTRGFGDMVFVEVGAMLVGRIVNREGVRTFSRGEEKGRFEFGGSTILVIIKAGIVSLRGEIITASELGRETPVRLGECVGIANLQ